MRISYNVKQIIIGSFLILLIIIVLGELILSPEIALHQPLLYLGIVIILAMLALLIRRVVLSFWKGEAGEEKVHRILANLPSNYYVLHDIILANRGNIDEVVISPKGIWTLEVKNIKGGEITFKNELLCKNGYPLEGKNLKQAYHEAKELQDFIHQSLNTFVPVNPVLVFANPRNTMKFGFQGINGVQVIGIDWLIKLLINPNLANSITPEQCITVRDEIKKYAATF